MDMRLKVFSGNANRSLAEAIAKELKIELGKALVGRFSDGEIQLKVEDNVRGADCFIIQPTCAPVNENIMELLIMADALRRASASRITAVMPYYGYARQDRKAEPRVPISSKLVANIIVASGVNRVLAMDLHASQIQGFFDIPVDHLYATPVLLSYFRAKKFSDLVVVSPDAGGVERARNFAKNLSADLAIVDKRRPRVNEAEIMNVIGEVNGKTAIILDDMVDTAGTLVKVAKAIKDKGAVRVMAACSHAILSGNAREKILNSDIEELVTTDSVPREQNGKDKIVTLSVAALLAEAISRVHNNESVSSLFVKERE
ncbi:MAG: ribose-phosphate pyrophosphokinase [Endomicrobiales bacterium]|nr:ribose-phosphate pyrophosphokinase [Endomicrobiales bacterium]